MSAGEVYRSAEYRRPCSRCRELSTWSCESCDEPRCDDHIPELAWCDDCEEDFARAMVGEGLYMVPRVGRSGRREPWRDRPGYWGWREDLRETGPVIGGAFGGLVAVAAIAGGATVVGGVVGVVALGLFVAATRYRSPHEHLEKRITAARRRYLDGQMKALPPAGEEEE